MNFIYSYYKRTLCFVTLALGYDDVSDASAVFVHSWKGSICFVLLREFDGEWQEAGVAL